MKKLLLIGLIAFCFTAQSQVLQQVYSNDTTISIIYSQDSTSKFLKKHILKSAFTENQIEVINDFNTTVNTDWKSNYQITKRTSLCNERILTETTDDVKGKIWYSSLTSEEKTICDNYKDLMASKL